MHQNDQIDISIFLIIYIHCCDLSKMLIICTDFIILLYHFYASYIWYHNKYNMSFNNFHDWNIMSVCNTKLKENKHTNYYHQVLWWMGPTYIHSNSEYIVFWNVMCIIHLYIALALLNFHFSCIHALYECRINSVEPASDSPMCIFCIFRFARHRVDTSKHSSCDFVFRDRFVLFN